MRDLGLALSIAAAVLVLMVQFPDVLLATLLRLSLSVATRRDPSREADYLGSDCQPVSRLVDNDRMRCTNA